MSRLAWTFSFLIGVIATSQLTACADSAVDSPSGYSTIYYSPYSATTLLDELKSAQLTCGPGAVCPESVGMIYSKMLDKYQQPAVGACSGFLVSDTVVATNQHCIPDSLKVAGATCSSDLLIRFLKPNSSEVEIHGCKRILSFSPNRLFFADYAFFEIEPTGRRPLKIARSGLQDHQRIQSIRVTPLQGYSHGGIIESESCENVLGSMLNMAGATPWSATGTAIGCSSHHGNSGSPVLNEGGEVIGILQSMALDEYRSFLAKNFSELNMQIPAQLPQHFHFTNLTCVTDPVTGATADSRCATVESYNLFSCAPLNNDATKTDYAAKLNAWARELPEIFAYDFVLDEATSAMEARPACVMPKKGHESIYANAVTQSGVVGFRTERIQLDFSGTATMNPVMKLDASLKMLPISFAPPKVTTQSIELERKKGVWSGSTYARDDLLSFEYKRAQRSISLKDCTPAQIQAKLDDKTQASVRTKAGTILSEADYMRQHPDENRVKPFCR